jgi:histidine phosphotransfer protein HptB
MSSDPLRPDDVAPPLDATSVQRLRELDPDGRHGVLQRVLQTFETSLQRQLVLVVEARERGDAAAVGGIAHMLKSSSASIGALPFSARCAEIERLVRSGAPFDLAAEVENLLTEGARALAAVRAMLKP